MATVIKKRKNKKELDEFISTSEHLFTAISENWEKFALIFALIVIVLLAVVYAGNAKSKKKAVMFQEISQIEGKITDANRDSVIQELEKVVEKNKGVKGTVYGEFVLAKQTLLAGNLEKGKIILQEIKTKNSSTLFSELASLELAYHLELAEKHAEAITQFQSIIDGGPDYAKAEAYLGLGRCREGTGDKSGALEAYKELVQKFPEYDTGIEFAKARVRVLES